MKLITLNSWAGRVKQPFEDFLKLHREDTDIFCFQEIFNKEEDEEAAESLKKNGANTNIFSEIKNLLTDYNAHFCPVAENVYGIAIFLKKGIEVMNSGEVLLYENAQYDFNDQESDHDRKMQWMYIKNGTKDVMVMNVHGHWDADGKNDTPNRIAQSKAINTFIESTGSIPKLLVGDFDLNPDTESIKLIEKYFINMVKEKDIKTTRTELYTGESRHADYVFVSPEVFVNEFKVLPDVVSDHSPLVITFDLF